MSADTSKVGETADTIVAKEQQLLFDWRQRRGRKQSAWSGLALSGGGIRSATFCLGALQALARKDQLKNFDYLSSVSGGGFVAASLQWWWSGRYDQAEQRGTTPLGAFGTGPGDFPYGTEHPDPGARQADEPRDSEAQRGILNFLRSHGWYLAPGDGINIWSGVAVVLRAVFLNLLVWISVAALISWILSRRWIEPAVLLILDYLPNDGSPLPGSLIPAAWGDAPLEPLGLRQVHTLPATFALIIWAAYALAALFAFFSIAYSFQTSRTVETGHATWTRGHSYWSVAAVAGIAVGIWLIRLAPDSGVFVLGTGITVLLGAVAVGWKMAVAGFRGVNFASAYMLRRSFETAAGRLFRWFVIGLALGLVPVAFKLAFTATSAPGMTGLFSVAGGVGAALWAHYQTLQKVVPGLASKILLPVGAALFLFGVAVLGYELAMILQDVDIITAGVDDGRTVYGTVSAGARMYLEAAIWAFLLTGIVSAFLVNTNQISLNRFYRDRLTEAFMPSAAAVWSGHVQPSSAADRFCLHELWPVTSAGPYPLINTNVVLVNDDDPKFRVRGGDSFVLSPFYCGSSATGWYETRERASRLITLPSAMATSGAAANPNAGYVGTGATRNRLLSIVMMLLNVRLGYWICNAHPKFNKRLKVFTPSHAIPGGKYALTGGWQKERKFLELSDGGHFDNLGVYELVRRKCGLIVVCDGEADKETAYRALVSAQRRIEEDFGATIVLEPNAGPELLVAKYPMDYPSGANRASQPFFKAKVVYADGSEATIVYMKATMIDQLSFKVKGYKGTNPTFPHEATADQFFDPEQFEAYRELGYRTCMEMMGKIDLPTLIAQSPIPGKPADAGNATA